MTCERFFLLLSGEHPTLPSAEAKALLRASGEKWRAVESRPQLLRVEASSAALAVAARAAYTRGAYREVLRTVNRREAILRRAVAVNFGPYLQAGQTFNVRVARLRGASRHLSTLDLERSLGSVILRKVESSRVSFRRPNVSFEGFLSEDLFILGVPLNYSRLSLKERSPRRKPFFHPSALHPKMARCLVNLTAPREGDFVVDPFCGTGSVSLEACLLGFESIAGDVKRRMVEGSRVNLNYYGCRDYHLVVADAMQLPLRKLRRVVANPPYGRSASTLGFTVATLTSGFLQALRETMAEDGRVVLVLPKGTTSEGMFKAAGFKPLSRHDLYVHKSLTRRIVTLARLR